MRSPRTVVSISLRTVILHELDSLAKATGVTRSAMIALLVGKECDIEDPRVVLERDRTRRAEMRLQVALQQTERARLAAESRDKIKALEAQVRMREADVFAYKQELETVRAQLGAVGRKSA
jgi:metal-responsive CopG/Arc/MetJ family transcriptional regulator